MYTGHVLRFRAVHWRKEAVVGRHRGGLTVEEELQSDVGNRLKVIFVLAKCIGIIIRGWKVKIFSKLCAVWPLIVVQLRNWIIYKSN